MAGLTWTQYRQWVCEALNHRMPEAALTTTDFWTMAQGEAMFPLLWHSLNNQQKQRALPHLITPIDDRVLMADALRMKNTTARILRAFRHAHIPVICMRGVALSETLYPHAYLRPHTDIDILFEEKHLLMAKQVVGNQLHFRPLSAYPMLFKQGDIPLDLHIEPIGSERIHSWKYITPLNTDDFFGIATKANWPEKTHCSYMPG